MIMKKQLLQEAIYGNMVTGFHRTKEEDIINEIYDTGFRPGTGAFYGHGCYGTYEKEAQFKENMQGYGNYILKYAVPVQNFIIFDWDIFIKTLNYKRIQDKLKKTNTDVTKDNFIWLQCKLFPKYDLTKYKGVQETFKILDKESKSYDDIEYTSEIARLLYVEFPILPYYVDGLILTGASDGKVIVTFNTNLIIPLGYYDDSKRKRPYKQFTLKKSTVQKKLLSLNEKPKRYTKEDMEKMKEFLKDVEDIEFVIYPIGSVIYTKGKSVYIWTDAKTLPMPILSVGDTFMMTAPNLEDYAVLPRMVYGSILLEIPDETFDKYREEIRPGCTKLSNEPPPFSIENKILTDEDIKILQEGKNRNILLYNCKCSKKIIINSKEKKNHSLDMAIITLDKNTFTDVEIGEGPIKLILKENILNTLKIRKSEKIYMRKYEFRDNKIQNFYNYDPYFGYCYYIDPHRKSLGLNRTDNLYFSGDVIPIVFDNFIKNSNKFDVYFKKASISPLAHKYNLIDYAKLTNFVYYNFDTIPSPDSSFYFDSNSILDVTTGVSISSFKILQVFTSIRAKMVIISPRISSINGDILLSNINTNVYPYRKKMTLNLFSGVLIDLSFVHLWTEGVIYIKNCECKIIAIKINQEIEAIKIENSLIDTLRLSYGVQWDFNGLETFSGNVKRIEVPVNAPYLETLRQSPALGNVLIETY
jgi:hypothetical protein